MTAPRETSIQNLPRELSSNKYFRAISNKHGVRQDMEAMCKFVRETLFYAMIHDTNGSGTNTSTDIMGENGKACQVFIHVFLRDKGKISNLELADSTLEEKSQYLKFLWKEGLQGKGKFNVRKALSNEKSAVYAGISESFKSKCVYQVRCISSLRILQFCLCVCGYKELVHDCTLNKVPFPALETFEDRKMFPKRYFLFFDVFVRAGRHNRELWKKAIKDNDGRNEKRFGPAIFEAHIRTTVRENYFKWIFQQLSDIHDVEDQDVEGFLMEYDEEIYTNLPKTLVCNHKELTRFPFKNCEISYGEIRAPRTVAEEDHVDGEDNDSFCSANGVNDPVTRVLNVSDPVKEKDFFLVYRNVNDKLFDQIREQQRIDIKSTIEKTIIQHQNVLKNFKETIMKVRQVKKTLADTNPMYKLAIADAKRELRLFKDPYEEDIAGHSLRKRRRKSIENRTRYSDSKITFFSEANETMKQEEKSGLRQSWEKLYKEIWNKHLIPKNPVINIPMPKVTSMVRDMENDVNQLLADCAEMVEEV